MISTLHILIQRKIHLSVVYNQRYIETELFLDMQPLLPTSIYSGWKKCLIATYHSWTGPHKGS